MDTYNYFNYYTEIEEYFWRKRGAHILVSTLDWAVIETWQKSGVPLEVVLKGIDRAFEHYDARRRGRPIKSLLYCVDAVAQVAEEAKEASAGRAPPGQSAERPPALELQEVKRFLRSCAGELRQAAQRAAENAPVAQAFHETGVALEGLAEQPGISTGNLEELERHLTVFEEKLRAALTQSLPAGELLELRREIERGLGPYRRKMRAEQLALVENQFLQKKLFDRYRLPRLSLFYLPLGGEPTPPQP